MTVYWETIDGTLIRPEEMSYAHRANSVAMAIRNTISKAEAQERAGWWWISGKYPEDAMGVIFDMQDILKDPLAYLVQKSEAIALMVELNDTEQA
jgi:hypothetical protein